MISSTRLLILLAVAVLALQGWQCESAPTFTTSSQNRHRPSTAEQTFVRGMMAADHQFGLYMTLSETSRGGGSHSNSDDDVDDQRIKPTWQEAMRRARNAAFSVGTIMRREAIRHFSVDDDKNP